MIKNKAIVFIKKDGFEYHDSAQSKSVNFIFQPNIIQDLEVIDKDQLKLAVKSFVEANKLAPANILYIIADSIIFEKTFALTAETNKDIEIQKFLENIPFEYVIYKLIDGQKDYKVLAINKELYGGFKLSFESVGFKVLGIIPQSSLGELYRNNQSLNSDIVKYVLSRFELLQKQGFTQEEIKSTTQSSDNEDLINAKKTPSPLNKYRLPLLLSLFVIVASILSFAVYIRYTQKSKASPVPSTILAPPIASPTPTIQETPSSTPSASPT
ncbi:hypothetical protein HY612_03215 [Candidatus Roizmanbacteria bacterium]|nr:hypothetical protein [Candidatus Roizmanbacteria bacterium]